MLSLCLYTKFRHRREREGRRETERERGSDISSISDANIGQKVHSSQLTLVLLYCCLVARYKVYFTATWSLATKYTSQPPGR